MSGFKPNTSLRKTLGAGANGELIVFTSFPFCQILGTLPLCECGRVFEDIRQVGGKRFSSKYQAHVTTSSMTERLEGWNCNPAVLSSIPALITASWICPRNSNPPRVTPRLCFLNSQVVCLRPIEIPYLAIIKVGSPVIMLPL